ncbi:MarR family winged helix-turn-helix transcriptional regulator [Labrenzia sp. PHM005]|uniref:MarR family winged helix-turn-helix transcriptional regulator n=1 Tax=Labrenzia sp. PHM005 TaxID=2590016 RepID=UPI001AD910C4|nr:MarR family winged helix-turn-helix transcriptional regulator [Labrenzia sp. PHM005]
MDEKTAHETPDFMDAWARLQRASTAVLDRVETQLKADGFPPLSWYDVLLELRRGPEKVLRPIEIEKRVLLAQYNVSRLIDRLAAAGLVEKQAAPDDGRGKVICLTSKGTDLLDKMWPAYEAAVRREFSDYLSQEDAADLLRILGKVLPK